MENTGCTSTIDCPVRRKVDERAMGKWCNEALQKLVITPGAAALIEKADRHDLEMIIYRFYMGDWGNVCEKDWATNVRSVKNDSQVLGEYTTSTEHKLWIIADPGHRSGRRRVTTVLRPEDY